jgi:hypothetical protein
MNAKPIDPQEYMDAIRQRVCAVCLDSRDDKSCGLTGRTCAVEGHLPDLVRALSSVESSRMEDYAAAIREQVCSACQHQDVNGRCELRDGGDCALDAYLSLVLDAVEEVNSRRAARSPSPTA